MKHIYILFAVWACAFSSAAQITQFGSPIAWDNKNLPSHIAFVDMPELDRQRLDLEDAITDQHRDVPWRFGVEQEVSLNPDNAGTWVVNPLNGRPVWQLGINCPEALSINLIFSRFNLPDGAKVFIWSADRSQYLGAFTSANNLPEGILATGILHTDRIVVEYHPNPKHAGELEVGTVVHGYRTLLKAPLQDDLDERGPFGSSDPCNVNVNCSTGSAWQNEKKAVALILLGGSLCSGAMVNNTAQDGKPYFLTANHCLGSNPATWVFYFNHESSGCSGNTGPTNQSISGATLRAKNANSDFALVELSSIPPQSWGIYYAGWDRTDNSSVTSGTGIHHPGGDIKKICVDSDNPSKVLAGDVNSWMVGDWEIGVTEPGSSGSPLFDQNHRIIGQLYAGASECVGSNSNNGQSDFYGRFGVSWAAGSSSSTRLREWLDPQNTGATVLNGTFPAGSSGNTADAGVTSLEGLNYAVCAATVQPSAVIKNNGQTTLTSCKVNYKLNGGSTQVVNWSGSLAAGQETSVQLPTLTLINGTNTLEIWTSNPNGQTDSNTGNDGGTVEFQAFTTGTTYSLYLYLLFDNFPGETSWQILRNNQVVYSGGPYGNQGPASDVYIPLCLAEGCYQFKIMDSEGDGMCCGQWGDGGYVLFNEAEEVYATGDEFGSSETTNFCVDGEANLIMEGERRPLVAYPNPASDQLTIELPESGSGLLEFYDTTGRLVKSERISGSRVNVDTSSLAPGFYTLRTRNGGDTFSTRVLIHR